ncbi:MAG: tandem-95 repeat protein [Planctomycetes bacterium]|nr:tandem-95 repeat protein [Planctomycetota bacterium]
MIARLRLLCRTHLVLGISLTLSTLSLATPPVAVDDFLHVAANSSVTADPKLNDDDVDGDALIITATTPPANGSVIGNADGSLTYIPNPGFVGDDGFTYDLTDGTSNVSADVRISINAPIDIDAARSQILSGVSALANPTQPGHMVVYGPTAYSVANYPGADLDDPMVAAATRGAGRIIALPDHQWVELDGFSGDANMATFYLNGIGWLAGSTDLSVSVVTYDDAGDAAWLTAQGFTNVVNSTAATIASDLIGADVLVAGWLGNNVSPSVLDAVDDFVRDGGGLFITEYGVGYDWWWGQPTEEIPGNRLLRGAGIGFTEDWPHGSASQSVNAASGQITVPDLLALVADWSGATESEKALKASILTKLDAVLAANDTLQATLDHAILTSSSTLKPTPTTPITDSFEKSLVAWESTYLHSVPVADTLAHRTAWPVGVSAPRISTTRILDAPDGHATIWMPTGLYAAPGEVVTLALPPGFQSVGLRARIGHLRTDLADANYYHMPFQEFFFDLDAPTIAVASPYGGLIAIEAASGEDGISSARFGFDNVVEAPTFVLGETTDDDWNGGIRDRQTPFGVLVTDKTIHVVESEEHLRTLSDPEAVLQIWRDMIQHIEEFYSYTEYRPLRIHHDYQAVGGFSTFPQSYDVHHVMLDYAELVNYGHGLTIHEYGHIVDPGEMIIQNFSEASPNFGGIYASRFFGPFTYRPKGPQERIRRYEESQSADLWATAPHTRHHEKITPFIALADAFGWNALIHVIAALKGTSPADNQAKLDNWLTLYGAEVGFDISPFFALWQLQPSPAALSAVASLPPWNMVETIEDRLLLHRDTAVTFPSPELNDYSYDGALTLVAITDPGHGALTAIGNGTFRYVPDAGFVGVDGFEYTVENGTGNSFTAAVAIRVLDEADSPKLFVGSAIASTTGWTIVELPHTYAAPVIIAQPVLPASATPVVTRIRNADASSFELLLQRTDGSSAPISGVTVNFLAAEEGTYSESSHGIKMEATRRPSTTTDSAGNLVGETFLPTWSLVDHYAEPVFFGQVMTTNDPDWSTWWSDATSQRVVAGKHVGGDPDTDRVDETLGFIALETGTLQFQQCYLRFGDTQDELLETFGAGGNTLSFPREPQITAALIQATSLEPGENPYWSVLIDTDDYAGNAVSMALRNDEGLSVPTERAGYIVAARIHSDCNTNGVPDEVEIALGIGADCDGNGVLDECDIVSGSASDNDGDGIPDSCRVLFRRGDVNTDGRLDVADPVAALGFLFSGTSVTCALALDANDDDTLDIADAVFSLSYLFVSGAPLPPPPFDACGSDPTPGSLTCDDFPICP